MYLFCDAAWGVDGETGLSCVITSDEYNVLRILTKKVHAADALEGEIRAVIMALDSLSKKARRMKNIVVYTDNLSVANAINGRCTTTHMDLIACAQEKRGNVEVRWIPRNKNSHADAVSVLALTNLSAASIKKNPLELVAIL